jgi:hypothetical protein
MLRISAIISSASGGSPKNRLSAGISMRPAREKKVRGLCRDHRHAADQQDAQDAKLIWSGSKKHKIDHREGCHHQAKAPEQNVAHRGSALRTSRFDCGLNYLSVFLLWHYPS